MLRSRPISKHSVEIRGVSPELAIAYCSEISLSR